MRRIEGVSARLMACAKKEFLGRGFSGASVRSIAAEAETSTRALYTRFTDKEGLFSALVSPVADEFKGIVRRSHEDYLANRSPERYDLSCAQGCRDLMGYVYDHRDEFALIVFRSQGTEFERYVDEVAELTFAYTDKSVARAGLEPALGESADAAGALLQRLITRSFFACFFEPVDNGVERADALDFAETLYRFHENGIAGVLGFRPGERR